MTMQGYFHVFPEKRTTELRTATFVDCTADDVLPNGIFLFTEYYCTDLTCNCQRVLVKVLYAPSKDASLTEVATIGYTWNRDPDATWAFVNSDMPNPYLDPLYRQAPYASELLQFWRAMVKRDKVYASRLERHYDEIRAEVGRTEEKREGGRMPSHKAQKGPFRRPTKREQLARKRLLARARKRK